MRVLAGACVLLADSYGNPKRPRREADDPLEVKAERWRLGVKSAYIGWEIQYPHAAQHNQHDDLHETKRSSNAFGEASIPNDEKQPQRQNWRKRRVT